MRTAASIPRRPDRLPRTWLLVVLLAAAGCAAGEREQGKAEQDKADVATPKAPAAPRAAEIAPGPSPADPAPTPSHLDRASLRVLGMT